MSAQMMSKPRIVISSTLQNDLQLHRLDRFNRELKLMMISCEENAPYGPAKVTANMFLQLLSMSSKRLYSSLNEDDGQNRIKSISITVYHAQNEDYPLSEQEWDSFDGIIIPGSLSSAYATHIPWIRRLHAVIREEIHNNQRKTLAVCFGHQSFAHAFGDADCKMNGSESVDSGRDGEAVKCPTGKKAGRKSFDLTSAGKCLLAHSVETSSGDSGDIQFKAPKTCVEMLYTHGDMVGTLPTIGLSLGGNRDVPIQSAAYFASEDLALQFEQYADSLQLKTSSSPSYRAVRADVLSRYGSDSLPYALTFQAHPEFTAPDGFKVNFVNVLKAMERLQHIDQSTSKHAHEDALKNFETILTDSVDAMVSVGVILGWF